MKISDSTITPTFLMSSSSLVKKNTPMKPFKFNRRLKNRMASLSKGVSPNPITINRFRIPVIPSWPNTQLIMPNLIATPTNNNPIPTNISASPGITPPSTDQPAQISSTYPLYKPFTTPRTTTTLIPLNICPIEYCQTGKSTPSPTPSVNIIQNHQKQNIFDHKSKGTVTTHVIDDWIIRESSEPFQRKENERSTKIVQPTNEEKKSIFNESSTSHSSSLLNVNKWTTDDVCSFFERVLGKNCYTSIVKEHLIDGTALLLLQDEHLSSIFQMQLGPRLKLLNCINKLKNGKAC